MRRGSLIFISVFILILPLILAAGGGGGGGGGGSGGSSSVKPAYSDLKCNDAGGIVFSRAPDYSPVQVEKLDGKVMEINGEWNKGTFTSDEAILRDPGMYIIIDPKLGRKKVTCPGFVFSCSLVNLDVNSCKINNQQLQLDFSLQGEGADVKDLDFKFRRPSKSTFQYSWGLQSPILINVENVKVSENQYQLKAMVTEPINNVQVSYKGCIGKNYVYSTIGCVEAPGEVAAAIQDGARDVSDKDQGKDKVSKANQEVKGKTLKCGGLMDIDERVRCRLQLRKEQKDEYENFFPEYCRAEEESEQGECLNLYRSVQGCWSAAAGSVRSTCFKQIIRLGAITEEKVNCQKAAASNKQCLDELREKVDHLVILRLYSLEEEAEQLMNQGKLTEDLVTAFTVKIEQLKVDYDRAETKQEKRRIISETRQEWIKLIRNIK